MKKLLPLATILLAPLPAIAAPQTFAQLATLIIQLLNAASGVAVTASIAVFFWGIVSQMWGKDKAASRASLIWGVVAIFVMVSIWGILNLLTNTFFSGSSGTTSTVCTGLSC